MLMRSDDGGVDHHVFVVGIVRQSLEKTLPNAALRPTRETRVRVLPAAEALRQITPRRARAEFPDHRLNKQPVAAIAVAPNVARAARQQILNPRKLVVPQTIAPHRKASQTKASYESRFTRFANPPIDDTP
jgi:hypothetical protein